MRHPFNLGIGGAVQTGYKYALERGYDIAVQVDGDGQHDPRCLPSCCATSRDHPELDMVTGSRFLAADGDGYRSLRAAPARHPHLLLGALARRRPARDRPDVGPAHDGRRGIELFARDYPHDYPEVEAVLLMHAPPRCASVELPVRMRERTRRRLVDQLDALDLLHDQGAARRRSSACSARARWSSRATARPSPRSTGSEMDVSRLQILAVLVTAGLFVLVFELVRRRRLLERYALLWLFSSAVLLGLSVWRGLLEELASAVGIFYAPSALFAVAFGFVLSCCCTSRWSSRALAEQTKVLAQRVGLLQHEVDRAASPARDAVEAAEVEQPVELTSQPLTALAVVIVAYDSTRVILPATLRRAAAAAARR